MTDTIKGFRGITKADFAKLALISPGYTIEYEMTIRAMKKRMRIAEIQTIAGKRIGGKTKGSSLRIGLAFLRCFVREIFQS